MKNILILIVICGAVWQFFLRDSDLLDTSYKKPEPEFSNSNAMKTLNKAKELAQPNGAYAYKCDGREYCSEMNSYEEAKYFIQYCPNTKMDGDGDGIPCESQFNK